MTADRESLDGLLHLMDRQVVDDDGRMVCKVDDLELSDLDEGGLGVTALLTGRSVWLPRLSRWVHARWRWLSVSESDREYPYRFGFDVVDEISSEIRLDRGREGLLSRDFDADREGCYQLSRLLGARVLDAGAEGQRELGTVLDVRLGSPGEESVRQPRTHLVVVSLVVGRGAPGLMLGYDRREAQGPWLLNKLVRFLHRGSGLVDADRIQRIDWEHGEVVVRGPLRPLEPANAPGRPLRDR